MGGILFVTWDGGGNVAPALGIATELIRRQHHVRVLGHPQQRASIEAKGFTFQPFTHAHPWSPLTPVPGMRGAMRYLFQVFTDRGIGQDVLAAAAESRPDMIVLDSLLFGGLQAADRAGLPRTALVHTLYSQQSRQWSSGMPAFLMRLRGIRGVDLWLRSNAVISATMPELDQCGKLPGHVHLTGPIWQGAKPTSATPNADDPLILVSLSTLYQDGQRQALQTILDAMAGLPVRAIVTTGPSIDPATVRAPANARVERYLPHAEVMPRASLVIGHGGHSTTMLALAHDLPLLILPMFLMGDQPAVGQAVEAAGAGRVLPKTASADEIRAAIMALLPEGPHREAARALGVRLRACDGAVAAADVVEQSLA